MTDEEKAKELPALINYDQKLLQIVENRPCLPVEAVVERIKTVNKSLLCQARYETMMEAAKEVRKADPYKNKDVVWLITTQNSISDYLCKLAEKKYGGGK